MFVSQSTTKLCNQFLISSTFNTSYMYHKFNVTGNLLFAQCQILESKGTKRGLMAKRRAHIYQCLLLVQLGPPTHMIAHGLRLEFRSDFGMFFLLWVINAQCLYIYRRETISEAYFNPLSINQNHRIVSYRTQEYIKIIQASRCTAIV